MRGWVWGLLFMTLSEKSELLRLLQLYQDDLLRKNRKNI